MLDNQIAEKLKEAGIQEHDFDSLWELLPTIKKFTRKMDYKYRATLIKDVSTSWLDMVDEDEYSLDGVNLHGKLIESPHTAVAMLLLWCIEQGHVSIEEPK